MSTCGFWFRFNLRSATIKMHRVFLAPSLCSIFDFSVIHYVMAHNCIQSNTQCISRLSSHFMHLWWDGCWQSKREQALKFCYLIHILLAYCRRRCCHHCTSYTVYTHTHTHGLFLFVVRCNVYCCRYKTGRYNCLE